MTKTARQIADEMNRTTSRIYQVIHEILTEAEDYYLSGTTIMVMPKGQKKIMKYFDSKHVEIQL